jgi:signal transduction histidine kinase
LRARHTVCPRGWQGAVYRFRHTLKWRLVSLFLVLAVVVTITFIGGMQHLLRAGWQGYGRPLASDYVDQLTAQIGTPPDIGKARALTERLPLSVRIDGPVVNWSSHPARRHPWELPHRVLSGSTSEWLHVRELPDGHRVTFGFADPSPSEMGPHYIGWATLTLLLLSTLLAYAYVRRLFRPLDDIRDGAIRYGQGDFAHRIPLRRPDELGDLAMQINDMAQEIERMLDAKRALLLAISHELRSPLTRARVNAELVDEGDARTALLRDLAEMRDLVTDLLESERLAGGHAVLQREPVDPNALVRDTLEAHFAGQVVTTALTPGLGPVPLDRVRVKLLLRNLLDNALRHSAQASRPPAWPPRWTASC